MLNRSEKIIGLTFNKKKYNCKKLRHEEKLKDGVSVMQFYYIRVDNEY